MIVQKTWTLPPLSEKEPSINLAIPSFIRKILFRRGFVDNESVKNFLEPSKPIDPILEFPDLDRALVRLEQACRNNERIAICGDYDADGMTSTAILITTLEELNAKPIFLIPDRIKDGYGLNIKMIEELHEQSINILITVDNGVSAHDALNLANNYLIDVILTDHHKLPPNIPKVHSLIHPETTPTNSSYRDLAGVGIAYILASSLAIRIKSKTALANAMDLFCIGTIADMASLTGANRYWLKEGIKNLKSTKCLGLTSLFQLCGFIDQRISSIDIAFKVAPRINAVGRIGEPKLIVDLLTETNSTKAFELAYKCDVLNRQRREISDSIEMEAKALIESDIKSLPNFLFITQTHWHQGVIGIVSSRLVEAYNRPTALLTSDGNGKLRASVRAPKTFNIIQTLEQCSDLLQNYGGHKAAAGFTVDPLNISKLEDRLNKLASSWLKTNADQITINPECHINFDKINFNILEDLSILEPYGVGNPEPIFWTRGCQVIERRVNRKGHLNFNLMQAGTKHQGIFWGYNNEPIDQKIDIAYKIKLNNWNNTKSIQLEVVAFKKYQEQVSINFRNQTYVATNPTIDQIKIKNKKGHTISAAINTNTNSLIIAEKADDPYVRTLFSLAAHSLGLTE